MMQTDCQSYHNTLLHSKRVIGQVRVGERRHYDCVIDRVTKLFGTTASRTKKFYFIFIIVRRTQ